MSKTSRVENLLLAIWVGSVAAIGYIAAPILFKTLERSVAGNVAGEMFAIVSIVGIVCGTLLVLLYLIRGEVRPHKQWRFWLLLSMLIFVLIGRFALQPIMSDLKAQGIDPGSDNARTFGIMHGISSSLYSLTSVFGIILIVGGLHAGKRRSGKDELTRFS